MAVGRILIEDVSARFFDRRHRQVPFFEALCGRGLASGAMVGEGLSQRRFSAASMHARAKAFRLLESTQPLLEGEVEPSEALLEPALDLIEPGRVLRLSLRHLSRPTTRPTDLCISKAWDRANRRAFVGPATTRRFAASPNRTPLFQPMVWRRLPLRSLVTRWTLEQRGPQGESDNRKTGAPRSRR